MRIDLRIAAYASVASHSRTAKLCFVFAAFALVGLGMGSANAVRAESLELEANDFNVGRVLEAEAPGSIQSALLDYDVYRRSVEPGLADLRVFDAAGKPVPYAIRRRVVKAAPESDSVIVPLFRLGQTPRAEFSYRGGVDGDAFRIDAEISASGAIVSLQNGSAGRIRADRSEGWLVDLSGVDRDVVGLDLSLAEEGGDFVSRMRLESSDDLATFQPVDAKIALARLSQNGHRIERTEFDIPKTRARYLRITPIGSAPEADLVAIRARLEPGAASPTRLRHSLVGRFDSETPGVVHFDLEATPPIESIQVRLAELNTIVDGRLESAPSPDGPWRVRQRGVFYFFDKDGELRNPAAGWRGTTDRYLRFTSSTRGGGLSGGPPSIEILWRPEQLLYVQRGAGNSILAIGRVDTVDGGFSPADLLRMGNRARIDAVEATASIGPEATLAGPSALERIVPIPWRSFGLWALLLLSVGVVLTLSFRLMRAHED